MRDNDTKAKAARLFRVMDSATVLFLVLASSALMGGASLLYNKVTDFSIEFSKIAVDVQLLPLMLVSLGCAICVFLGTYLVFTGTLLVRTGQGRDTASTFVECLSPKRLPVVGSRLMVLLASLAVLVLGVVMYGKSTETGLSSTYVYASFTVLTMMSIYGGMGAGYAAHRTYVVNAHDPGAAVADQNGVVTVLFRTFGLIPRPYSMTLAPLLSFLIGLLNMSVAIILSATFPGVVRVDLFAAGVATSVVVMCVALWAMRWATRHAKRGTHKYWVAGRFDYLRPELDDDFEEVAA